MTEIEKWSLSYYRGALEEAIRECAGIEKALGLKDGEHINLYHRLYQWKRLLDALERDEISRLKLRHLTLHRTVDGKRLECFTLRAGARDEHMAAYLSGCIDAYEEVLRIIETMLFNHDEEENLSNAE